MMAGSSATAHRSAGRQMRLPEPIRCVLSTASSAHCRRSREGAVPPGVRRERIAKAYPGRAVQPPGGGYQSRRRALPYPICAKIAASTRSRYGSRRITVGTYYGATIGFGIILLLSFTAPAARPPLLQRRCKRTSNRADVRAGRPQRRVRVTTRSAL